MNTKTSQQRFNAFIAGASFEVLPKYINAESVRFIAPATKVFLGHQDSGDEYMDEMFGAMRTLKKAGAAPVPHIAARRIPSANFLAEMTAELENMAINHVFVVAGDLPRPAGPYQDSMALLRSGLLDRFPEIDMAGYPDGHRVISRTAQITALREKLAITRGNGQQAGISTLLGFNHQTITDWLDKTSDIAGDAAIRITIPGPCSVYRKARFAVKFGQSGLLSYMFAQRAALATIASTTPAPLVEKLLDTPHNITPRFSTFNAFARSAAYVNALRQQPTTGLTPS